LTVYEWNYIDARAAARQWGRNSVHLSELEVDCLDDRHQALEFIGDVVPALISLSE
jgi:hypothetical protein